MDKLLWDIIDRGQARGQAAHAARIRRQTVLRHALAAVIIAGTLATGAVVFAQDCNANPPSCSQMFVGGGTRIGPMPCESYSYCSLWRWVKWIQEVF
jgi:hypothetical protein